jgi:tetratricopeptide (TPR) repeat protein
MSEQDKSGDGSLIQVGRCDLALVATANPMVARGIANLATLDILPRPAPETSLAEQVELQRLLDEGKDGGYLTYRQVSDYLGARVFRIEPDGPVKVLPGDAANEQKLANILAILDKHDIELLYETEIIPVDDYNALFYFNRGNAWFEEDDYDRAIEDFDEAIRLDPEHAASYFHRGRARQQKGEYEESIKDFSEVIRLDPTMAPRLNSVLRDLQERRET